MGWYFFKSLAIGNILNCFNLLASPLTIYFWIWLLNISFDVFEKSIKHFYKYLGFLLLNCRYIFGKISKENWIKFLVKFRSISGDFRFISETYESLSVRSRWVGMYSRQGLAIKISRRSKKPAIQCLRTYNSRYM